MSFFLQKTNKPYIFYSSVQFYLTRGVAAGHRFCQMQWLLSEDQLEVICSFMQGAFLWSSCSHPLSQGLDGAANLWHLLIIKKNSLFRRRPLFHNFHCSYWSFHVGYLFLFHKKNDSHSFFKGYFILFDGINCNFTLLSNSFSGNVYFLKKCGSSYAFLQKYYDYFYKNIRSHAFFQRYCPLF